MFDTNFSDDRYHDHHTSSVSMTISKFDMHPASLYEAEPLRCLIST